MCANNGKQHRSGHGGCLWRLISLAMFYLVRGAAGHTHHTVAVKWQVVDAPNPVAGCCPGTLHNCI
jgi:hypothetical protein